MNGRVAVRVVVSGRVQGVWFRAWTADEAKRLSLDGWVRNVAGGTVEAVFAGAADAVAAMVALCRTGPPKARVSDLVEESAEDPGRVGFSVR